MHLTRNTLYQQPTNYATIILEHEVLQSRLRLLSWQHDRNSYLGKGKILKNSVIFKSLKCIYTVSRSFREIWNISKLLLFIGHLYSVGPATVRCIFS
jgi:hypothetical protein